MVRLPFATDNRSWLRGNPCSRQPSWNHKLKCWETPKAWFDDVVGRSLERNGSAYVIQPYRAQEKCAPACWNAKGLECECSWSGEHHGSESQGWKVISETFAVRWHDRQLGCRLIRLPDTNPNRLAGEL